MDYVPSDNDYEQKMTFENGEYVAVKECNSRSELGLIKPHAKTNAFKDTLVKSSTLDPKPVINDDALVTAVTDTRTNESNKLRMSSNVGQVLNESSMPRVEFDSKPDFVPPGHPDTDKWFYLDPQSQVQGPFSTAQMAAWSAAGYFNVDVMIKRGNDLSFAPLGKSRPILAQLIQVKTISMGIRSFDFDAWPFAV